MGCIFGCFRSKDKQHYPPDSTTTASARKTRVSHNQLSDLFAAREIEDFSSNEKTDPPEIVDTMCLDAIAHKEIDSSKNVQFCTPAKCGEVHIGLDSTEGTPSSCICDPPNPGRIMASSTEKSENIRMCSLQKHKNRPISLHDNLEQEGSLSTWLKPVQHNNVGDKKVIYGIGRTGRDAGDIPILGTVATYWNEKVQPSAIPLKLWDGNGIPNSTNKYREDQKVSWHATPFEERLEKALSEEKSLSQMKHINSTHMAFEDNEIDTAASQLSSLAHPKSVVSC